jgi:hypothetical protein
VDAQIVLNFHTMREESPEKFFSRLVNQLWYGIVGWKEIWTPHCTNLKQFIKLKADGELIDLPDNTEGLIFSNIPSFGGGMKLWNDDSVRPGGGGSFSTFLKGSSISSMDMSALMHQDMDSLIDNAIGNSSNINTGTSTSTMRNRKVKSSPNLADMKGENSPRSRPGQGDDIWVVPSIQDKKLEVVAVTGSQQLALLKLGLTSCTKIAQCEKLEIETFRPLPFQVDGEPWIQHNCSIELSPSDAGQVAVLKRHVNGTGANQDVLDVLNWAERGSIITNVQKNAMLGEFSRRRELRQTS